MVSTCFSWLKVWPVSKLVLLAAFFLLSLGFTPSVKSQPSPTDITSIAWRADGKLVAVSTRSDVWLYTSDGAPVTELVIEPGFQPESLSWHPSEHKLALAASSRTIDERIYVWSVTGNPPNITIVADEPIRVEFLGLGGLSWSPDTRLAMAYGSDEIGIWDTANNTLVQYIDPKENILIDGVAWSPDGARLAASVLDEVRVFNTTNYQQVSVLESQNSEDYPGPLAWSPTGNQLAIGEGKSIIIWEYDASTDSFQPITTLTQSPDYVFWLDWRGDRLAATCNDYIIRVWDTTTWEVIDTFPSSTVPKSGFALALSPDGSRVAYANEDEKLGIGVVPSTESQDSEVIYKEIAWHPNGEIIAVATTEEVWLYTSKLEPITELSIDTGLEAVYLEWNPAGTLLVAAANTHSGDDRIYIWSVSGSAQDLNATLDHTIEQVGIGIGGMTWSPDTRLAIANGTTLISVWNIATGKLLQSLNPDGNVPVSGMAWSPDGLRLMVSVADDVRVFDMTNYQEINVLERQEPEVFTIPLFWNPAGTQLAVGEDSSIVIWEYEASTDSFQVMTTLTQSPEIILRLDWQADRLAASTADNMIRVWDTTTWEVIDTIPFSSIPETIYALALSPDGTQLAYVNQNDVLEIAEISTEE